MKFDRLNEYANKWPTFARDTLAEFFDLSTEWINDSVYFTPDEMAINSGSEIKSLPDGYELDADRLLAIQQRNSRGFQIVDVNPGLLDVLDYPLNLPFEFLFDGTNFLPDQNGAIATNFRTVNIPIQGNYLKVEFLNEINGMSNLYSYVGAGDRYVPKADIKYSSAFTPPWNEWDPGTGNSNSSLDVYARTKIYLDFGANTGKPHLIGQNGKIFETYFSEVNLHLNIGAPKVRITIGFNSKVSEASNVSPINSQLHLTGSGRLLADIDTTLAPFNLTSQDNKYLGTSFGGQFVSGAAFVNNVQTYPVVFNNSGNFTGNQVISNGYSVLWLTQLNFSAISEVGLTNIQGWFRVEYIVTDGTDVKRIFQTELKYASDGVINISLATPIRVVIPSGHYIAVRFSFGRYTAGSTVFYVSYSLSGYSLGEIIRTNFLGNNTFMTTKFITDAVYLPDINVVDCI